MTKPSDKLDAMFQMREDFMRVLHDKNPDAHPDSWPLDLTTKENQQFCRDMVIRGVEEMFEALQHLKNWKPHRMTDIPEVDREAFLEEIVDAFNYFLSVVVLTGFSADDLYESYESKDEVIHTRLKEGY